jgi:hypothetical protein
MGEVTPAYCTLERGQLGELAEAFPKLKILLMIRNPVERAWSQCRMELFSRKGLRAGQVSEREICRFLFEDRGVLARSEYSRIIQDWTDFFAKDALLVGLFDELETAPKKLARRVFDFLGIQVDYDELDSISGKRVFKGVEIVIPDLVRKKLIEHYATEIEKTSELLPHANIAERWLNG